MYNLDEGEFHIGKRLKYFSNDKYAVKKGDDIFGSIARYINPMHDANGILRYIEIYGDRSNHIATYKVNNNVSSFLVVDDNE